MLFIGICFVGVNVCVRKAKRQLMCFIMVITER